MYKRKEGTGLFLIIITIAALLSGCGGGGATALPAEQQNLLSPEQAAPVVETAVENLDGSPADVSGLPELPAGTTPARGSSAVGDGEVPSVRGNDYINAGNATETDRGLLLHPPGFGLAWALYGIDGLNDYDVLGLDVQAAPLEGASGYFVAVGNYSNRSWTITGPHVDGAKVRLPEDASFISPAGSLYFVVFTVDPKGALMQGASVILDGGDDRPMRRPHAPWGLEASDGTVDGGIGLSWNAPHRGVVDNYVVFRRLQPDEAPGEHDLEVRGFVAIGRTENTRFLDDNARPHTRYFYTVVAVNEAGRSAHSNVDGGWWGRITDHPGLFITGIATTEDGRPVPGIMVAIGDGTDRARVLTNDNGRFIFRNLESGLYILKAQADNDHLIVLPETVRVELGDESKRGIHFIVKRIGDGSGDDRPGDGGGDDRPGDGGGDDRPDDDGGDDVPDDDGGDDVPDDDGGDSITD